MNQSVCLSIEAFNDARDELTLTLFLGSLVVLCLMCSCIILSAPFLYWLRHEPMFHKIRPLKQLLFNNLMLCTAICGYIIPSITRAFPCSLELAIHVLSAAIIVSTFSQRALLFIVESEHTRHISKDILLASLETKPKTNFQDGEITRTKLNAVNLFLRVGLKMKRFNALTLSELVSLRTNMNAIYFFLLLPPMFILCICIVAIPRLRCVECAMTWEFLVIIFGSTALGVVVNLSIIFTAISKEYNDVHYVRMELAFMFLFGCVFIYPGYGFEIGDPGLLHYNRVFSWRLVLSLGPFSFWACSSLFPVITALRHKHARARVPLIERISAYDGGDFVEFIQSNIELKHQFDLFSTERLCLENLNFLRDVKLFQKNVTVESAKKLTKIYIANNAIQEINVSYRVKTALLAVDLEGCTLLVLSVVFHDAYIEIQNMVISGTWIDFVMLEKKRAKKMALI